MNGCKDTWKSIGQSYLSHMGQWDWMDSRISMIARTHGNPLDSPTYPKWKGGIGWTVGYQWLQGHMEIHWTVLPILNGKVG